jgi:hypothetical protein
MNVEYSHEIRQLLQVLCAFHYPKIPNEIFHKSAPAPFPIAPHSTGVPSKPSRKDKLGVNLLHVLGRPIFSDNRQSSGILGYVIAPAAHSAKFRSWSRGTHSEGVESEST